MTISVKSVFCPIFGFRSPVKMKLGKIIFPIQPATREWNAKKIIFFFYKRIGTKICLNSAFTSRLRKNLNIRNAHAVGIRSEHSGRPEPVRTSDFRTSDFRAPGSGSAFQLARIPNPGRDLKYLKTPLDGFFWSHILWMKNTARNKQIVFFVESRKTVKLKLF